MTMEPPVAIERKFARAILPWLLAGVALVLYFATASRGLSLINLLQVAKTSGWAWQSESAKPVTFLLLYPFRWLPATLIPIALNLFSAACGALIIALLARSVCLLPQDRTHQQRLREQNEFGLLSARIAWLPPVLASIALGLQLTFWEYSTNGTGDIIDLLLPAYIIRCLLEYRVQGQESWLARAVLLYGAAMTNTWMMIALFPVFLGALIWIKGFDFFRPGFLARMFVWGLVGLLLYLLLPLVHLLGDSAGPTFWQMLKLNLGTQKSILIQLSNYFRHSEPWKFIALIITSLVPLVLAGIRWPSYFGDISKIGQGLATLTFHIVHALLLVACVWLAFDPPFSARQMQFGNEFLVLNYFACLNVGYFSGYFLLVFAPKLRPIRTRHRERLVPMLNRLSNAALWLLMVVVPLILLYKNLPHIRITNGPLIGQFSASLAEKLPVDGAYVLSDDPRLLFLLQNELARRKQPEQRYVLLDSGVHGEGLQALNWPQYHRFLHKKYAEQWPEVPPLKQKEMIAPYSLLQMLTQAAAKKPLYYLHPSFGYYFEVFYPVPHGLVYELKTLGTNSAVPPPVSDELIAENEKFWKDGQSGVVGDVIAANRLNTAAVSKFRADLHAALQMPTTRNGTARTLAGFCSRALNFWSIEAQKAGHTNQAGQGFNLALEVNPDNVAAQINADFNQSLQAAPAKRPKVKELVDDPRFRNLDQVVIENGPFDEPTFCLERAREFARSVLYRQAAQQLVRVVAWEPANLEGQLWLARIYTVLSMPVRAVAIVNDIHARASEFNLSGTNQIELLLVESAAHFANRDNAAGEAVLRTALEKNPNDESVIATAAQMAIAYGRYSNALVAVERQLALKADDVNSLVNKGFLLMQLGQLEQAIPPLNRALELSPTNHPALLNRAIIYLRSGKLDQSEQDYLVLQKAFPNAFQIYYGLGEIAWQRKNTNAAIAYYDAYLTNKPPASTEAESVAERLKQLKGGSP